MKFHSFLVRHCANASTIFITIKYKSQNKWFAQDHTRCAVGNIVKITTKCSMLPWRERETGDIILFLKNMKKSSEILHSSLVEKFSIRFSLPRTLIFYQKTFLDLPLAWCLFSMGSCLFLFEFFHVILHLLFYLLWVSAVLLAIQILSLSLSACLVITCRLQVLQVGITREIATNGEQMSWIIKKMECYPDSGYLFW